MRRPVFTHAEWDAVSNLGADFYRHVWGDAKPIVRVRAWHQYPVDQQCGEMIFYGGPAGGGMGG